MTRLQRIAAIICAGLAERIPVLIQKYGKKYPELNAEVIEYLNGVDPTGNQALYTEWLVRGTIRAQQELGVPLPECRRALGNFLKIFDKAKSLKGFRKVFSPDINTYTPFEPGVSLTKTTAEMETWIAEQEQFENAKKTSGHAETVYRQGAWRIVRVSGGATAENIRTVCSLASDSGWCVGSSEEYQREGRGRHFNTKGEDYASFYLSQGPLYFFLENGKRRGLYSPSTRQFTDEYNRIIEDYGDTRRRLWNDYQIQITKSQPHRRRETVDNVELIDLRRSRNNFIVPFLRHLGSPVYNTKEFSIAVLNKETGEVTGLYNEKHDYVLTKGRRFLWESEAPELFQALHSFHTPLFPHQEPRGRFASGATTIIAGIEERIPVLLQKYQKKFPNLNEAAIREINSFDPTGDRALYTEWLVRNYGDEIRLLSEFISDRLEVFDEAKRLPQFKALGLNPDINSYDANEFLDLGAEFYHAIRLNQKDKEERALAAQRDKLATLVYEEGAWQIYRIGGRTPAENTRALCALAKNSGWCVKVEHQADWYLARGPLYLFLEDGKRRALYSPSTRQMMDAQNQSIPNRGGERGEIWDLWSRYVANAKQAPFRKKHETQVSVQFANFRLVDIVNLPESEKFELKQDLGLHKQTGNVTVAIYSQSGVQGWYLWGLYSETLDKILRGPHVIADKTDYSELYEKCRAFTYPLFAKREAAMKRSAAPRIDEEVQRTYWRLGDALARALRSPHDGEPGDPRWTVSGRAVGGWSIEHPELPIVKGETGAKKDVLLQMHIAQEGDRYIIVAQNKVVGPESHSSPRALVVSTQDTPPGKDWDVDSIAQAAAEFFFQQKKELVSVAQALTPNAPMGGASNPQESTPGIMPGAGGPILGSRLRRIARLVLGGPAVLPEAPTHEPTTYPDVEPYRPETEPEPYHPAPEPQRTPDTDPFEPSWPEDLPFSEPKMRTSMFVDPMKRLMQKEPWTPEDVQTLFAMGRGWNTAEGYLHSFQKEHGPGPYPKQQVIDWHKKQILGW